MFQGDVEVSVNNDCYIVLMSVYKGIDAKIPQGKIVSHFITGDGNCGFRSIAYCLFKDQELHHFVRTAACEAIKGNATSFLNKIGGLNSTGSNTTANQSVEDYLADKATVSQHAGQTGGRIRTSGLVWTRPWALTARAGAGSRTGGRIHPLTAIYLADSGKFQIHMINSLVSHTGLKFAGWTIGSRKQRRVGTAAGVHASEVSLAWQGSTEEASWLHLSLPYSQGTQ